MRILGIGRWMVVLALMANARLAAQETAPTALPASAPTSAPTTQPTSQPADEFLGSESIGALKWRSIGPATTSGRIGDIAIHPHDPTTWYIGVASGGVWKTTNSGTTFSPIFDAQGSYSIGCITIDPQNPLNVWVGTGENNSQRSVSYGDGVYKSVDGGKSWTNVGLPTSEHIGKIIVDPRNSDVVYVASQGPLWSDGGERGLHKTIDGGKTWTAVLTISDKTGVSDIALDPYAPDTIYAVAYQRRRHVWTLLDGGPESGIHKSTDGGKTWKKLGGGLPGGDVGRIGIAVSPLHSNVVYAIVEATGKNGGFFRSEDYGVNWDKRSDYVAGSPQYYQEIFCDPKDIDRVYSMDVTIQVTEDGGKTFRGAGEKSKHVDNHALWIDPADTRHLIVGCDGGLYESYDRAENWRYFANLPVTQFYRVSTDNALPFYNVFGGTQDNYSLGGPSQTRASHGIDNDDWFVTCGGDGFETVVDPTDPDTIYSQSQYGGLVRFDRRTGESIDIQPQPEPGEPGLRWNWDSPLMISPHDPKRLYFAANRLFRSDDRGNTWTPVSPDLSRGLDRNTLKVMGKTWSVDAVAKNMSTSAFGNITALSESPIVEGLVFVGTDDGLLQVTEDGGKNWRKIEQFPDVPEMTYVSSITASQHDSNVVYVTLANYKMGDFKPYVLRSADRGKTFRSIASNLPARGSVFCLAEDHVRPGLLFVGTEFSVRATTDGGEHWFALKSGMPTIQVRDLAIQKRENDLVAATFGRGFYVLDDYTPLRTIGPKKIDAEFVLFPVKDALWFTPSRPIGSGGKGFLGETFFTAPNPPFGATITYYLKNELKTKKALRRDAEKKIEKDGGSITHPTAADLEAEDREEAPTIILVILDASGRPIRELTGPTASGLSRVTWDLRIPSLATGGAPAGGDDEGGGAPGRGPLVQPGEFFVEAWKSIDGVRSRLAEKAAFVVRPLDPSIVGKDRADIAAFAERARQLQRAVSGASAILADARSRTDRIQSGLKAVPQAPSTLREEAAAIENLLRDLQKELSGDALARARQETTPPSISERLNRAYFAVAGSTIPPTTTHRRAVDIAATEFDALQKKIGEAVDVRLKKLEDAAEAAGAPIVP